MLTLATLFSSGGRTPSDGPARAAKLAGNGALSGTLDEACLFGHVLLCAVRERRNGNPLDHSDSCRFDHRTWKHSSVAGFYPRLAPLNPRSPACRNLPQIYVVSDALSCRGYRRPEDLRSIRNKALRIAAHSMLSSLFMLQNPRCPLLCCDLVPSASSVLTQ